MKKFNKRLLAAVLAGSFVLLTGCGGNTSSTTDEESSADSAAVGESTDDTSGDALEPQYGGVLKYASYETCSTPGYTPELTNNSSLIFLTTAYESLIYYDEEGNIIPKLATEWETNSEEPSITWTLRQGVQFADGTDFNAEAVKRNIEEYQKVKRNETSNVKSVEVIDDYTVKMYLNEWNTSTLEAVGFFVYYMSPAALDNPDSLRESSCGTGPFQVTDFSSGVHVKYAKNENYWQENKPYLDGVELYVVGEPTTVSSAFQAKEYDMALVSNTTIAQSLSQNPEYIMQLNESGVGQVGFGIIPNSADPESPFADPLVRKAMCYAIDSEAITQAFGYGFMQPTNQWAAPGAKTYSEDVITYEYNPEKSKELLAEAGYTEPVDVQVTCVAAQKDIFTAVTNMLNESGFNATLDLVDEMAQVSMYSNGNWPGIMGHYFSSSPDLGLYMGRHLDIGAPFYANGIQHPDDAMALLQEIRVADTEEEKIALELEMQQLIYNDYALFGQPVAINIEPIFKQKYVHDDRRGIDHAAAWSIENAWMEQH